MSEKNNENMILSLGAIKDKFNDRLVIPDHQRPYDWKEKEWERLIMDIMTAYDDYKKGNQNSQIFLGMITLTPSKKEPGRYEVIDGQQRLTTLTVLMDVIYYRIQWNENTNTKETKHTYLKIKDLKAVRKSNIIEDDGFGNDNYTLTYNYFAGVLFNTYQLETNELKKVFSFIEKRMYFFVEFVDEIIKHNAFEKLNAAGVPLVYTDLVLNHLISMAEEEKNQTAMEIKKTWKALLETISSEQLPPDDDESENESEQAAYEESDDTSAADRGSDKTQKEKTEQLKPLKIKKFFNALHNLTLPYRESFPETVDDFIRMFDRLRKSFSPECNQTNSVFILDLMKDWSNYYLAYVSPAKSGYPDKIKQHLYYLRTIGNTSLIPAVMRTLFRLNNDKLREDRLNDEDVENIFHALVTAQMLRAVYLERENTTDTANKLRIADYIYKTIPNKTYLSLLSSLVPVELYKKAVELDSTAINKKLWNLPYCSGMSKAILAVRYDAVNKEKLFIFEKNNGPVQVEHMVALKANVNPGKYGYTYDTVNTFRNLELLEADLNKAAGDNEPEKKTDQ